MTTTEKRAALLAMLRAAKTLARDLADDLTASLDDHVRGETFASDTAASNAAVGDMLPIEHAAKSLEALRVAALALNMVPS